MGLPKDIISAMCCGRIKIVLAGLVTICFVCVPGDNSSREALPLYFVFGDCGADITADDVLGARSAFVNSERVVSMLTYKPTGRLHFVGDKVGVIAVALKGWFVCWLLKNFI